MRRAIPLVAMFALAACTPEVPTAPSEPANLTVFEAPPTGTPGWLLDNSLSVRLTDRTGNPMPGVSVKWDAEESGARVEDASIAPAQPFTEMNPAWVTSSTTTTDEHGVARVRYLPGWARGTQRVSATAGAMRITVPVPVTSFSATSVVIDQTHACGLDTEGRLYCWKPAWRARGSVPTVLPGSMRPMVANTAERFMMLTGGDEFNDAQFCGLTTQNQLRCFTKDNIDAANVATPVAVATPATFVSISGTVDGGANPSQFRPGLCGLDATGQAWCRGSNRSGQLGDETFTSRLTFAPVAGPVRFRSLTLNSNRACGVDAEDRAWCWGGVETIVTTPFIGDFLPIPAPAGGNGRYSEVAPITGGACGITAIGNRLECWGGGRPERVVTLTEANRRVPYPIMGRPLVRGMSGDGTGSGQFLTLDGRIANWGDQLPFDMTIVSEPEYEAGLTGFDRILTQSTGAICSSHVSGSTVCSWVYYRGVGVPVP